LGPLRGQLGSAFGLAEREEGTVNRELRTEVGGVGNGVTVTIPARPSLTDYEGVAHLAPSVDSLRRRAESVAAALEGRTVWMVNSTAQGGGVAEMLPTMVTLLNELGIRTKWFVMETDRRAVLPPDQGDPQPDPRRGRPVRGRG
jgi:hypothetical protein